MFLAEICKVIMVNLNNTYSLLKFLPVSESTGGIAFDLTGDSFYATTIKKVIKMSSETGEIVQTFDERNKTVDTVILSQDGRKLLVATDAGHITIWDVLSGRIWKENEKMLISDVYPYIRHVIASPDFTWVASIVRATKYENGIQGGALVLWDPSADTSRKLDIVPSYSTSWISTTGSGNLIAYNDESADRISVFSSERFFNRSYVLWKQPIFS